MLMHDIAANGMDMDMDKAACIWMDRWWMDGGWMVDGCVYVPRAPHLSVVDCGRRSKAAVEEACNDGWAAGGGRRLVLHQA